MKLAIISSLLLFALLQQCNAWCRSNVYHNYRCLRVPPTRSIIEHTLRFGAYIGGSHTCDNLRAKGQPTTWTDQENGKWHVNWGATVNVCFPSGGSVHFRSGWINERQGHDRQTRYLCCEFRKMTGGWGRDDFTRVCCDGLAKGSGIAHTGTDYFAKVIELVNAGAPYAQAAASALAATKGK